MEGTHARPGGTSKKAARGARNGRDHKSTRRSRRGCARARRCGARTRAGHPCRQAAVTGRARCRMHGWASMHLSRRCDTLCRGNLLCMGFLLEHEPLLEGHRKRLREALGNTLSDEFVDVILGKLVEALRPGLYDQLDEATLNAALATIDSMQPRSELQAILAVQIIATGFAGL